MNDYGSIAKVSRYYEQFKVVIDLKDSELWANDSRWYEKLRVVIEMNDSRSWAPGYRSYD